LKANDYRLLAKGCHLDHLDQATTYVRGTLSGDIRVWVTKRSAGGDKDYEVTVQNLTGNELYISVAAYRVGL
jgi:hypothetical protein